MDKVVIGYGYVGKATAKAFGIKDYITRHESTISFEEASKRKFIFICLPTPTVDGRVFFEDIFSLIAKFSNLSKDNIFIIRSTVPPGFAEVVKSQLGVKVVSNPEFLSEDTWEDDAIHPKMIILGGEGKSLEAVKGVYMGRFKYSTPIITDNTTAEMTKYAFNTFFATKVVFSNEIFNACQKSKANYETVKLALQNHPWGMKNHNVIFYKGRRGVHGSCLPKDTEAFANITDSKFFKVISEARYE